LSAGFARGINYHGTPNRYAGILREHFGYLSRHYASLGPEDLASLLAGERQDSRPGVIISFDDGLFSNYAVAAPLLEEHGLRGWFFLPAGLIESADGANASDMAELARSHRIRVPTEDQAGPVFMTWHEARNLLARGHVVGCHTMNHTRLPPSVDGAVLQREIVDAKRLMEERLSQTVDSFCWVGGEEDNYSRDAALMIASAAYRFSFMTQAGLIVPGADPRQLHRVNIEADWPLSWVEFYLSGIMDMVRARARRRIDTVTRVSWPPDE
jgi:peptidoglycan/xylan/chitin deacetylase (PgdA/CDA1 family)